jgi:CRISPR system Cascade subunit CasE
MTAPLYMVKLTPDMHRFVGWAHQHRLVDRGGDLSYAVHAALTAAFGDHAPKPFRLYERRSRAAPAAVAADLYGYTAADGPTLLDHARAFADPEIASGLDVDGLAIKAMPVAWASGRRLGFEVRVRPVIRRDRLRDRDRTCERDAFQIACEQAEADVTGVNVELPRRDGVYRAWLAEHLDRLGGARLIEDSVRLSAFQRLRVARRGRETAERRRPLVSNEGPDAVLAGILEVTDGAAFAALLRRGIGRHRAFGFGMLLLRPTASEASVC